MIYSSAGFHDEAQQETSHHHQQQGLFHQDSLVPSSRFFQTEKGESQSGQDASAVQQYTPGGKTPDPVPQNRPACPGSSSASHEHATDQKAISSSAPGRESWKGRVRALCEAGQNPVQGPSVPIDPVNAIHRSSEQGHVGLTFTNRTIFNGLALVSTCALGLAFAEDIKHKIKSVFHWPWNGNPTRAMMASSSISKKRVLDRVKERDRKRKYRARVRFEEGNVGSDNGDYFLSPSDETLRGGEHQQYQDYYGKDAPDSVLISSSRRRDSDRDQTTLRPGRNEHAGLPKQPFSFVSGSGNRV